jgi:putative endonuclease
MQPAVYILASKRNGTLYIGVTSNLSQRISQNRENQVSGFSNKYRTHILVWYQFYETMLAAIEAEKKLKKWDREWKVQLIEKANPYWQDLEI